jgi:hypothetical protein
MTFFEWLSNADASRILFIIGAACLCLLGVGMLALVLPAMWSRREEKADRANPAPPTSVPPAVTGPRFGPGAPRRERSWLDDTDVWGQW